MLGSLNRVEHLELRLQQSKYVHKYIWRHEIHGCRHIRNMFSDPIFYVFIYIFFFGVCGKCYRMFVL